MFLEKYKCQVAGCAARFVNSSNLLRHVKKFHPREVSKKAERKRYVCERCGRKFPQNMGLKGHKGICGVGFNYKSNMTHHMRRQHDIKKEKSGKKTIKCNLVSVKIF